MEQQTCPKCKSPINSNFYFCPNCGKKLKEPPVKMDAGKIVGIVLLSIFLPPLGLWPGIRYLKSQDQNVRIVGVIAIVLTAVSIVVTIWYSVIMVQNINKSINSQLNELNGLPLDRSFQ